MLVTDNKRIAKNTLYLYFRMFLIMAVTLYTSRIYLQVLGETDFGIYNIVGGVIVLLSLLVIVCLLLLSVFLIMKWVKVIGRG